MQQKNESFAFYDLVVIGGGINGCGIAADAAGRGLKVLLCEQDDLAQHTSSASSKLIHGGLRYLEQYQFRLVRESLQEREILLKKAPHLIHPMRFILPYRSHLRPIWMIRLGLFIYDYLGGGKQLAASKYMHIDAKNSPLQDDIVRGFEYSDSTVDDARLVVLNAVQAAEHGAKILTHTRCTQASREDKGWCVALENKQGIFHVQARALVNAAGPWVNHFLTASVHQSTPYPLRLVQGSHIVVRRLYPELKAHILQNDDQRIVFVIPYLDEYTLIGTTDHDYQGDPAQVKLTIAERDYLIDIVNRYFKVQIAAHDIVHDFSGVRALIDHHAQSMSTNTRDYVLHLDRNEQQCATLLSIYGGKLTTYRRLAEKVLLALQSDFDHMGPSWTAEAALPGAEGLNSMQSLVDQLLAHITALPSSVAQRWAQAYGTRVWKMLGQCRDYADCGVDFGAGLRSVEVDYLMDVEWAMEVDDVLWRRTKLGLKLNNEQRLILIDYMKQMNDKKTSGSAA